jgi:hypothetical protein
METTLHYTLHLVLIPLLEIYTSELMCLFSNLLEDGCVAMQGRIDIVEVLKPERSLKIEFIQQERCEVYVQMAMGSHG